MFENQPWMRDSDGLGYELAQCAEEGRDISGLKEKIDAILAMPAGSEKEKAAGDLLDATLALPIVEGYPYCEPTERDGIQAEAPGIADIPFSGDLYDRVYGGWLGRCCGCLLGKPYEGWRRGKIYALLKATENFPPTGYTSSQGKEDVFASLEADPKACWINNVAYMPEDDDTNYTLIALKLMERCGRSFTSADMADTWLRDLPYFHLCTAERVGYRNLVNLHEPPESGSYRNSYREWIGAQIRGDLFGYINPGRMAEAAGMAWRDAVMTHVKNGVYGEMMIAAMIAAAYTTTDIRSIIRAGLAVIPRRCRLAAAVEEALGWVDQGLTDMQALDRIHEKWDEANGHDWCHTISNAVICVVALVYGGGDFTRTLSISLMGALDTDCNAATVGSILGVMLGAKALPASWTAPLQDTLLSGVDGFGRVKISDMARRTLAFCPSVSR